MKVSRFISVAILVCFCILSMQAHRAEQTKQVQQTCQAKQVGLKTNMLYWATATPNLGLEMAVGKKHTAQVFFGLNPWKQSGGDHSSLRHWMVMPEYRY